MAGAKKYQVKTALVIAKDEAGSDVYLYLGAPVPSSIPTDEIKRLVEGEFISEVKDAEPVEEVTK